ncbi:SHOCT domain-containing protein [Virgibacillus sp. DJP39]|uniref:SHOCT domain-containing protein n=1 Tax=Virgibacillus sp. DJP39 TaxID=3409790 RepID=UPI003BB7B3E0
MMGYGHGFGMFGSGGGSFMMIVVFLLIGFLVYLGIKSQNKDNKNSSQPVAGSNALEIAKSRLAKGEITVEEFEQIKKNVM